MSDINQAVGKFNEAAMTDRNQAIGTFMVVVGMAISKEMDDLGVPPHLKPNCLWAVKKYMRKVLRDLTDSEIQLDVITLQNLVKTYPSFGPIISSQPDLLLSNDLRHLIRSAIRGYLNYKKV
ncbi:MAG: hypothetical protein FJ023_09405 [Chloroflexi bacterium]|nr:hypothetical protein [Chloroflexota bacterium]